MVIDERSIVPISRNDLAVVAIGRNEGERLRRCLLSAVPISDQIVYVDSGSDDGSVQLAQSLGATVVELNLDRPFTAARARNEGIERVMELWPDTALVHVIDGDCELISGWVEAATTYLEVHDGVAAVCGRCLERHPEKTIYNRLCDMEWAGPEGEIDAVGGISIIRLSAFNDVGGFDPALVAGEEPEMCFRMRQKGWKIYRIAKDMVFHDADMTHFGQWWRRTVRSGHAYAEGQALHGKLHSGYRAKEVRSIMVWGVILPLTIVFTVVGGGPAFLSLICLYPVLWRRIRRYRMKVGDSPPHANLYATFCVIGKFASVQGVLRYWWNRLRGRRTKLIEYRKQPTA